MDVKIESITRSVAIAAAIAAFAQVRAEAYVLFGDGYVPRAEDTYVPADAGACCFGEYRTLTAQYLAQTFQATGSTPTSLTLGLANNLPSDVPAAPFRFRLLFTQAFGGFSPGAVLWESGDLSIPADVSGFHEYTLSLSGLNFSVGEQYAWVLDTYSTRDGLEDAGAYFANVGIDVPPYSYGGLYGQSASGLGRATDFAAPWVATGIDAAFLIRYSAVVPEPGTAGLALFALVSAVMSRRRSTTEKARTT